MAHTNIEDMNAKLVDAEHKLLSRVENIAYAEGRHPDEVYAELIIQFSDFIETKYAPKKTTGKKKTKINP